MVQTTRVRPSEGIVGGVFRAARKSPPRLGCWSGSRRRPPRGHGWVPYVGGAALAMVLVGILGYGGAASPPASSQLIRGPAAAPPRAGVCEVFAHKAGIALRGPPACSRSACRRPGWRWYRGSGSGRSRPTRRPTGSPGRRWAWFPTASCSCRLSGWPAPWISSGWRSSGRGLRGSRRRRSPSLVLECYTLVGLSLALLLVAAMVAGLVTFHVP